MDEPQPLAFELTPVDLLGRRSSAVLRPIASHDEPDALTDCTAFALGVLRATAGTGGLPPNEWLRCIRDDQAKAGAPPMSPATLRRATRILEGQKLVANVGTHKRPRHSLPADPNQ